MEKYQYMKIEEYIMEGIYSGKFPADYLLPTEKELCQQFNVSRMTVNKALNNIAKKGFVERVRGSGSYVKLPNVEKQSVVMSAFTEQYERKGFKVTTKLLSYQIIKTKDFSKFNLAKKLCINTNEPIHYFVRLRFGDGEPMAIQYTYVPVSRIPAIDVNSLNKSFYEYLEKKLKLSLGNGESVMQVVLPTEEIARYLNISTQDPVVYTAHMSCLRNGLPFEYVDTYCVWNKYSLNFVNKREY